MKSSRKVIAISVAMAAVMSGMVRGNTWRGDELRRKWREAAWKYGPFRLQPSFVLSNAGYDSNVYYGAAADPVRDYTITAGPGLTVYLPVKKKLVFTAYDSPQYIYYFRTARERTWNNYFSSQAHLILNKFYISVGGGYSDARERWNTEIDLRPRRKEESLQGSVLWQASIKTSFSLAWRRARYRYENLEFEIFNIRDELNRDEDYWNFTGYYQLTYRTRLFGEAEYGRFEFKNPGSFRDSESYGVYGGLEFSPTGRIRGRVHLGYKYFNSRAGLKPDFRGIVGDTNISVRLLRRLNLRAHYKRDVQFSLWYDNTFFLESRAGGGASFYVYKKKIRLDYDFSLGRNRYPHVPSGGRGKREDDYTLHTIGVYFRVKNAMGIGLTLSRWIRDSNLDWEDDKRDFVGANLTYDF